MIFSRAMTAMLLTMLIGVLPAYADNGQATVEKIIALFSVGTNNAAQSEALSKRIDFEDMAQSATAEYWQKLSSAEKRELIQLIRKLVSEDYYPRWHKLFKTGKVTYNGETVTGNDTYVKTTLTLGKKDSYVNWRLHAHDGELQVLSLSVGQKDLLATMQKRFQAKLHAAGFNGLISWLKEKQHNENTVGETATELR